MGAPLTVAQAFDQFKSNLELSQSFQDVVTTHHNAVRQWIESHNPKVKTKLIGSLQRKTRIQPRPHKDGFDIDILVVLGNFDGWVPSGGITPTAALHEVEHVVSLHETYRRMGPETDNPAIVLPYADNVEVELIPSYSDHVGFAPDNTPTPPIGRGYWIPRKNKWVVADYDYDAQQVSTANQRSDGYLTPTIKMLKAAKRNLFPDMQSYHLEALATSILPNIISLQKNRGWQVSYPRLLWAFFFLCKDRILEPVKMPGSKSPFADSYVSAERKKQLSGVFADYATYCEVTMSADDADAIDAWGKLFGPPFPSAN